MRTMSGSREMRAALMQWQAAPPRSPLTPALSPLRGEGARRTSLVKRLPLAALGMIELYDPKRRTRRHACEFRSASLATPSPLNGERAGVRGEHGRGASSIFAILLPRRFPDFAIRVWLGALVMFASVSPSRAAEGDSTTAPTLEGTWRWTFTMPDGTITRPKLKFTVEEGQLSGTTSFRAGTETPVTNILVNGDRLNFQVIRRRNGEDVLTT